MHGESTPVIETESLGKSYGDVTAVESLDLTVRAGEVFGFLGPNGAGKSTTIDVLLDLVRPTTGTASVVGHDPQRNPRAVRERVGVLPEDAGYRERATAREQVAFAVEMKRADDDPLALLERVGIADAADRPVEGFSTGMRRRLGLATALVGEPDLLVLDEPMAGLDPDGARRFRDIVRAERDRGAAVFLSSHVMDQVETLCDRVGVMADGELVAVDTIAGLRRRVDADGRTEVVADADHGFAAIDGVEGVTERDGTVRVTCTDIAAVQSAVARLDDAGGRLLGVKRRPVPLERLFVELTREGSETTPGVDA